MKTLYLAAVAAACVSISSNANELPPEFKEYNAWADDSGKGCEYRGQRYAFGDKTLMNSEAINAYKERTGYMPSDGYGILMQCTYMVDTNTDDHPPLEARKYVWAAFSW